MAIPDRSSAGGSLKRSAILINLLFLSLSLSACGADLGSALPTRAATAAAPLLLAAVPGSLPATFTPNAQAIQAGIVAAATPTPTATLEPTPTLKPTATASATPAPLAFTDFFPAPVDAFYLDGPPEAVDCAGRGLVYRSAFPSAVDGRWRNYHAYLPPCYGSDYPVLYLFHGSIQTDSHWLELGLAAYAGNGIAAGRYPPFVVIMPYNDRLGNMTSGGPHSIEGIVVDDLLPYIAAGYCIWDAPEGRSIGGISRGGYWALEIAFSHPGLFGAVAGHSSHLRLETDPPRYNPLVTYASADLSRLRIWLDRGEIDFLRAGQDALHDSLAAAGIRHDYVIHPGGHSDVYWAGHLPEYLDWQAAAWPRDRALYPPCA
jgi:enterochelin esterase-like enzyme